MKHLFQEEKKSHNLRWVGVVAILGLLLAACAPATPAATAVPSATTAPTAAATSASTGVVINVATDATLGKILVDGAGMTLYKYASDTSGTSTCSATCLANWPPVLATGAAVPDPSLTATDFATTMTTDGRSVVTYKGSPLYHYKDDQAAGDTKGSGIGGVWSVVAP